MDRGAWQAPVHGVARVGHNLATKPSHGAVSDNALFGFLGSWPEVVSSFESLFIKTNPFKSPVFNAYLISQAFPELAIILSSEFQDQYNNIFLRVPAYIRILDWFIIYTKFWASLVTQMAKNPPAKQET